MNLVIAGGLLALLMATPATVQPRHRDPAAPAPARRTHAPPAPGRLEAALRTVAGERNLDMVRKLLDQGADPASADERGETALLAAVRGRAALHNNDDPTPLLTLLIEKGSDVNARDADGISPLMASADRHEPDVVNYLLDHGAQVNAADAQGRTPLMHAAVTRLGNDVAATVRTIDVLLAQHADIKALDAAGLTALHYAVQQHLSESGGVLSHVEVVSALLAAGAPVNAQSKEGSTPLLISIAAWRGPLNVVKLLLDNGADVNARDRAGATPLLIAARIGKIDEIRLLLAHHADVNPAVGEHPLTVAIEAGQSDVAGELLAAGAKLTATRYENPQQAMAAARDFALMAAADRGEVERAAELIKAGASIAARDAAGRTALHRAAASYSPAEAVVRLFIESGSDVSAADAEGNTPLALAAGRHAPAVLSMLIEKGAKVDAANRAGTTALLVAAQADDPHSVALLLEHGADAKARDVRGRGALALNVAHALSTQTMASLIKAGADVNATDDDGRTPLMAAAGAANLDAVQVLVWRGAAAGTRSKDGVTAIDVARSARAVSELSRADAQRLDEIIVFLDGPPGPRK